MGREISAMECKIDELFLDAVHRFGERTAVICGEESFTWRELDRRSDLMAGRLARAGIAAGERVGLWGENSAAWIVTFLALQKLGAVPALLNFNYQRQELEKVVRISDIHWLCYGDTPALAENPRLVDTAAGRFGESFRGATDIREELPEEPGPYTARRAGSGCRDLACVLYTTGTSMAPKCVMHSHYSLVNNAVFTVERTRMNEEDRICVSQPLFHIFGLVTSFLSAVCCGATLCILARFGSETILRCVERNRCTILNGVPTNFICMFSHPRFGNYKTDSLRLSIIGGASILPSQIEYIRQAFPTVHIMRNYGLTEGCNLCNSEYEDDPATVARTVGRPYPCIELAIWDPKQKRFLPAGEKGEIVARGYSVMQGYFRYGGPDEIPEAIDSDGWLHTGDLGIMDDEGRVSIAGRIKDIIIRGGENISPLEVNREILRYEPVLDATVLGVAHPILGEEVIACLMLETPEDYSEEELRAMLKTRLARYKIPAFFLVYDQFPLKTSGKMDVLELRRDVEAKVRELHRDDVRYHSAK